MNSVLDQQHQEYEEDTRVRTNMSIACGYIRVWKDTDGNEHYELTEKGVKRLATLMV